MPEPPAEEIEIPAEAFEEAIGTARVNASALNIRREASPRAELLGRAARSERVEILARGKEWTRVRTAGGVKGWAATRYLREEKRCLPDREFSLVEAPPMTFSDSGAHGAVVVEAMVGADGRVTTAKLLSNATGDEALGEIALSEVKRATFSPPVKDCAPRRFIYTYRRTF